MMNVFRRALMRPGIALFYAGSMLTGVINYFFNVVMARDAFLGPSNFGVFAALASALYLEGIIAQALTTTVANHVAVLRGNQQTSNIGFFLKQLGGKVNVFGAVLALLVLLATPAVASFLHLAARLPVALLAPLLWATLLLSVGSGSLQGLLAFGFLSAVAVVSALLRLLLALLFVGYWQLEVTGALLAGLIGTIVATGVSVIALWPYWQGSERRGPNESVFSLRSLAIYGGHTLIAVASLSLLFSVDVILARYYLTALEAGLYSGLSILGRVIYFASLPIVMMMFPALSQRLASGRPTRALILLAGASVLVISVLVYVGYAAAPERIIRFTIGPSYVSAASALPLFALLFALISLVTWLAHVFLAQRKLVIASLSLVAPILQLILITRWHSSIQAIAVNSVIAVATLLLIWLGAAIWSFRRAASPVPVDK